MRNPFRFAQHGRCGMWMSAAAPRRTRGRPRLDPLDVHDQPDARAGDLLDPIGQDGPGAADPGLLGRVWAGQREPEPAGLRRARRSAGAADQRRRKLGGGLSAALVPGNALPLDRSPVLNLRPDVDQPEMVRGNEICSPGSTTCIGGNGRASPTSTPASPATNWRRACNWRRPTPSTSPRKATRELYGVGRAADRFVWPAMPDRPPAGGARRPLRAALHQRPDLGQPHRAGDRAQVGVRPH